MIQQIDTLESIARILTTPLVQRVNMPYYGSKLFELIDKPITDEWVLLASDYTFEAIELNEPRVEIKNVKIDTGDEVLIHIEFIENGRLRVLHLGFGEVQNVAA